MAAGPWHYPSMPVFEGNDGRDLVRFAIGKPQERIPVYGRERGWISVWEVVNGQPRHQRAVFVETDDFSITGDHVAPIAGKGGEGKKLFEPSERDLLPAVYDGMRVEVHRDRCSGPNAKNRLTVVAREDEFEVMLNHALAHRHVRS